MLKWLILGPLQMDQLPRILQKYHYIQLDEVWRYVRGRDGDRDGHNYELPPYVRKM